MTLQTLESVTPDLPALAGGSPVRDRFLPFARVEVGPEAEAAVLTALRSGWISQGPAVARFEERIRYYVGTASAVAVSSCTAGLHLLLRAAAIGPGDDVVTSAMTFPATANAILHAGARPVLADVDADRLTMTAATLERAWTPKTRAVIAVHFAGWPCDMGPIAEFCRARGAILLEDAAHALGARYRGRRAGALADAAAFSFYATKNLTTGDGGMVTTDREDLAARIRVARLHGIDVDASRRTGRDFVHWEAVALGWKFNMTDLEASRGLAQMDGVDAAIERRRELDRRYRERLAHIEALEFLAGPADAESAAHLFVVRLREGHLTIDRDTVLQALLAENIGVGVHFRALPCHRFFRDEIGLVGDTVPVSMADSARVFSLPLDPALSDGEQDDVVAAVTRIAAHYAR